MALAPLSLLIHVSVRAPQAILHQEGHMDDALSLTRSQREESQAARMIYSTSGLYSHFIRWGPVGSGVKAGWGVRPRLGAGGGS